jgi:glycosyltransferase involved in cell wall biosynthesis
MTGGEPLFSVIIPVLNRANLIGEALESVFAQDFTDYEIVVVDDGSTDDTVDVLKRSESRLMICQSHGAGPGIARNLGAKTARGKYLAFLDSDDLWFPWTLAAYARVLAVDPDATFIAGSGVQLGCVPDFDWSDFKATSYECLFATGDIVVPTPAVAFSRSRFVQLGGFRNLLVCEDMDLWLRAGCLGGFVRVVNPPLFAQREHVAQVTKGLDRSLNGLRFVMNEELAGTYAGGQRFSRVRARRIARAARSLSLRCLAAGHSRDAWSLYCAALWMNLRLHRWRYLLGFPSRAALSALSLRSRHSHG